MRPVIFKIVHIPYPSLNTQIDIICIKKIYIERNSTLICVTIFICLIFRRKGICFYIKHVCFCFLIKQLFKCL